MVLLWLVALLQTRLNIMLEQHVNNEELRNLSPSELYALFPSPFSRSGGYVVCVCAKCALESIVIDPVSRFHLTMRYRDYVCD